MKKALLASTAMFAVAAIASPANAADKIKLGLGGNMKQYVGIVDNEDDSGTTKFASFDVKSSNKVFISGSTTLDNGVKISARMDFNGHKAGTADEAYMKIQTDFGSLMVGENDGASDDFANNMKRGISGDHDNWIVPRGINRAMGDDSYTAPDGDSNKLNYTTPSINGFQAGVSYSPEIGVSGSGGATPERLADTSSGIGAGASYKGSFSDVGVNLTYAFATALGDGVTTVTSGHHVGLELSHAGFTAGAAYGRQMGNDVSTDDDGWTYHASISYKSGPMLVGFYHQFESTEQAAGGGEDEVSLNSIFFNYAISDGVKWESMVFNSAYDAGAAGTADSAYNSGGWGVVGGLNLAF
ncbi:MAG: porin [Proteobacteria bacterium]|nr:porin [Pseudomonadota bacterium]